MDADSEVEGSLRHKFEDESESEWETISETSFTDSFGDLLCDDDTNQPGEDSDEDMVPSDEYSDEDMDQSEKESDDDMFQFEEDSDADTDLSGEESDEEDRIKSEDSDEDVKLSGEDSCEEEYQGKHSLGALVKLYGPTKLFSGNPLKWTKFWMAFERYRFVCWVFGRALTKAKLLAALKRFLTGEARAAVESFTGDQYSEAVALLKEKYGKPELIEQACLRYIAELPRLRSENQDDLIHLLYDVWTKLQYFAKHPDRRQVYSEQLVYGLLSKLPPVFRSEILKRCDSSSQLTPEKLMSEFRLQIDINCLRMFAEIVGQFGSI